MRLLEYEVKNWGPHRHRLLTFSPEARIVAITGDNDQGKSWLVRGTGAIFSTGKNEYADPSAIHDGEDEAEIRQRYLSAQNEQFEIIRRFTKADSEAGNLILLNGEKISPTNFERFLNEKLRIKEARVFLPITISMQGETHFYLKSKKRDREEGLRTLTELDRIDAWKEHLTKQTSLFDKKLAEDKNTLRGRKETTEGQILKENAQIEELQKSIFLLVKGTTPAGKDWDLVIQLQAASQWKALCDERKKLEGEIANLNANLQLYRDRLEKLKSQKEGNPLGTLTPEDLIKKEGELQQEEENHKNALLWLDILEAEKKLEELLAEEKLLQEKEESLKKGLDTETAANIQELLHEINSAEKALQELEPKEGAVSKNVDELNASLTATRAELEIRRQEENNVQNAKRLFDRSYKHFLTKVTDITGLQEGTFDIFEEYLHKRIEELKAKLTSQPINATEATLMAQRFLTNWKEGEANICPLCTTDVASQPHFHTKAQRDAFAEQLFQSLEATGDEGKKDEHKTLKTLIFAEETLKTLPALREEHAQLFEDQNVLKPKTPSSVLEKRINDLESEIKAAGKVEDARKRRADNLALLAKATAVPEEQAVNKAKSLLTAEETRKEAFTATTSKLAEIRKQKTAAVEHEKKLKTGAPEKTPAIKLLLSSSIEEIKKELGLIQTEVKTFRTSRTELDPINQQILQWTTQLNETLSSLQEKANLLKTSQEKTPESIGLLHPEDTGTPEDAIKEWEAKEKSRLEKQTVLDAMLPKIKGLEADLVQISKELDAVTAATEDLEAAQALTLFLDYKNAPRRLLSQTVDKVFTKTNTMARAFQLGMVLHQGKALDFTVKQARHGREITQKTERLGFGKANILGICMRIACQGILLPEVGFLIFDEPSAHVDERKKGFLREFFAQISTSTPNAGEPKIPQIILVEHDQDVISCANQIIRID